MGAKYAAPMSHGGADHATMIDKNQMVEGSSVVPAGRHLASKAAGTRVETEEVREIAAKISSNLIIMREVLSHLK